MNELYSLARVIPAPVFYSWLLFAARRLDLERFLFTQDCIPIFSILTHSNPLLPPTNSPATCSHCNPAILLSQMIGRLFGRAL